MSLKRAIVYMASLLLILGTAAGTAQAKKYSLVPEKSGGQLHIGGGLPLPIQLVGTTGGTAMNITATGTHFPPLLVPGKNGVVLDGTTAMSTGQALVIPPGVLGTSRGQFTLGQFANNPSLHAVATNIGYAWPNVTVALNNAPRATTTQTFVTPSLNQIRYSNSLGKMFGGAAQFAINANVGQGYVPTAAVTVFAIGGGTPGVPPCTHTFWVTGGTAAPGPGNPACVALLIKASPNTVGAAGAAVGFFAMTPGGAVPAPNAGPGQFGASPTGTVLNFIRAASGPPISNQASSFGYPWTTGMLTISAMTALGTPEIFKITGKDLRTAGGGGLIQLVAGSLSQRAFTGPNANRAWVRLFLRPVEQNPTLSPVAQGGMAALMLLAGGYVMRRRFFSGAA